ncbi:MAG: hypothetical protein N3A69_03635 [Leptospiraceae bacterium]|nr:hypothetical protein [Leptospiraceae bacterium]
MLKFLIIFTIPFLLFSCKKSEEKTNKTALVGLLLLNRPKSLGAGSQTLAEYFGDSSALTSEDSIESGASGSTGGVRSFSSEITSGSGSVTITNEEFNCRLGGTVTFSGSQTLTVNSRTSPQVFSLTLSNGFRKIQYKDCKVSLGLTINSGEITIEQTSPATLQSEVESGSNIVRRTLNNLNATVKGNLNLTLSGRRGSGTATVDIDQTLTLTQRVREWTLSFGRLRFPVLKSRQGSLTGTVTVNGKSYNINKSLDVNVESDD